MQRSYFQYRPLPGSGAGDSAGSHLADRGRISWPLGLQLVLGAVLTLGKIDVSRAQSADVRIAVIGDYGADTQSEGEVAAKVRSWDPAARRLFNRTRPVWLA